MTETQIRKMNSAFVEALAKAFDASDSEGQWRWCPSPRQAFELGFKAAVASLESDVSPKKKVTKPA